MRPETYTVDGFTIETGYVRFVEAELRRFTGRKQRLARLIEEAPLTEKDVILGTSTNVEPGMPRAPGVGRPTESTVIAVLQRRKRLEERAHLTAQVRTVQEVYDALPEDLQKVVKTVYFDGLYTVDGAAMALGLDRKTVRQRCLRAVIAFALVIVGDFAVITEVS